MFSVTGKTHRAALILLFTMMMAPSCMGEFLKKMLSINRCEISASMVSPVLLKYFSSEDFARTIMAPVLSFAICLQAFTIAETSRATRFCDCQFQGRIWRVNGF